MQMRNWLELSRKLIDQFDLDASFQWVQQTIGYYTLAFFGFGVQVTAQFPNPFAVTMSGSSLGGSVGYGIAFDPNGQIIQVNADSTSDTEFTLDAADQTFARWDLLVISYTQSGQDLIAKPSNPLSSVYLNLVDDFDIEVIAGTPSATPTYPSKPDGSVILAGLRVPAGAAMGSAVTVDVGVRENASGAIAQNPVFAQEVLSGSVDGTNTVFTLSQVPLNSGSLVVFLDSLKQVQQDFTLSGQTVTLTQAPTQGQVVSAYYVVEQPTSQNPLSGVQEKPKEIPNGSNTLFSLTGQPADQSSTIVFVDGLQLSPASWDLIQQVQSAQIQFHSDQIPSTGQSVDVFYLVNPASVGIAPQASSGGGGSSGATYTPQVWYVTLSDQDISNGYSTLPLQPAFPSKTLLDIIGGGAQVYGSDFTVSNNVLTFGMSLRTGSSALAAGDQLRIFSWT